MRNIFSLLFVFILISFTIKVNALNNVIIEDCSSWAYSSAYSQAENTCDTCWYYENRLYKWTSYAFWDWFKNIEKKEIIFSSTSRSKVSWLNWFNWSYMKLWGWQILSDWIPNSAWIDRIKEVVAFYIDPFVINQTPAKEDKDKPVVLFDYFIRWAVPSVWPISLTPPDSSWKWAWNKWVVSWSVLNFNVQYWDTLTRNITNPDSIFEHTECYVALASWCWDWVVDSLYWESCDPADTTKVWWWDLWCSATCNPLNSTPPWWGWGWWGWGWGWGWWWGWWGITFCWDWSLQRPNDDMIMEECDLGWSSPWSNWPSWCGNPDSASACKIWTITVPRWWVPEITIPWDWVIKFWPQDNIIIWDWMNPYDSAGIPYIKNESSYDFYFDKLCVAKKSWTTLIWSDSCVTLWQINSWQTKSFPIIPNIVWNTSTLASSSNYWDNRLVTTIEHNGILYSDAYFAWPLNVRVTKPSIASIWWGNSFVRSTNNVSNISDTSAWILDSNENKNFVWAWISGWNISSYSKDLTDTTSVNKISDKWVKFENDINVITNESWINSLIDVFSLPTDKYNWLSNVFILKNKNLVVNTDLFSSLSWPKTYIIENWNLVIEKNINYHDNIAFVVKWWNIIIDKTVEKMSWTYITIKKLQADWSYIWWNFTSNDTSLKQLLITGNIYWNINDLVSKRTYIKNNAGQLNVWTIVSFWSSLFKKPAPLLATFIDEYLKSSKIAR